MSVVIALIVFSLLGALICVRARAAGPALFFGVLAVVLLAMTPLGAQLGTFITDIVDEVSSAAVQAGAR